MLSARVAGQAVESTAESEPASEALSFELTHPVSGAAPGASANHTTITKTARNVAGSSRGNEVGIANGFVRIEGDFAGSRAAFPTTRVPRATARAAAPACPCSPVQ